MSAQLGRIVRAVISNGYRPDHVESKMMADELVRLRLAEGAAADIIEGFVFPYGDVRRDDANMAAARAYLEARKK